MNLLFAFLCRQSLQFEVTWIDKSHSDFDSSNFLLQFSCANPSTPTAQDRSFSGPFFFGTPSKPPPAPSPATNFQSLNYFWKPPPQVILCKSAHADPSGPLVFGTPHNATIQWHPPYKGAAETPVTALPPKRLSADAGAGRDGSTGLTMTPAAAPAAQSRLSGRILNMTLQNRQVDLEYILNMASLRVGETRRHWDADALPPYLSPCEPCRFICRTSLRYWSVQSMTRICIHSICVCQRRLTWISAGCRRRPPAESDASREPTP